MRRLWLIFCLLWAGAGLAPAEEAVQVAGTIYRQYTPCTGDMFRMEPSTIAMGKKYSVRLPLFCEMAPKDKNFQPEMTLEFEPRVEGKVITLAVGSLKTLVWDEKTDQPLKEEFRFIQKVFPGKTYSITFTPRKGDPSQTVKIDWSFELVEEVGK